MPAYLFQQSQVCPVPFMEMDAVQNEAYHTKHLRQDWFALSQLWWQRKIYYQQKWQLADNITVQFNLPVSGPSVVRLVVIDCNATELASIPLDQSFIATGSLFAGEPMATYQYKFTYGSISLPKGRYWMVVEVTYDDLIKRYISEPQDVRESWPYTIRIDYGHDRNEYDTIFSINPNFGIRVEGEMQWVQLSYNDSTYRDEINTPTLLHSDSVDEYELKVGAYGKYNKEAGVPKWLIQLIGKCLQCSSVAVDTLLVTREEGGAFDIQERTPTPLAIATITMLGQRPDQLTAFGVGEVFITNVPAGYPYAFSPLYINNGFGNIDLTQNQAVEIENGTDLANILAYMNGLPQFQGAFVVVGGDLVYQPGLGEKYSSGTGTTFAKYSQFSLQSGAGTPSFRYQFRGTSHVAVYNNNTPQYVTTNTLPSPNLKSVPVVGTPLPINTSSQLRIYHNDNITRLAFNGPIGDVKLTQMTAGTLSAALQLFVIDGHDVPAWILDEFNPSSNIIHTIRIVNSNLESFVNAVSFNTPLPQYALTTVFDFHNNALDAGEMENLVSSILNNTSYAHPAVLDLTDNVPPNSATALMITYLTAAGWAVYTD